LRGGFKKGGGQPRKGGRFFLYPDRGRRKNYERPDVFKEKLSPRKGVSIGKKKDRDAGLGGTRSSTMPPDDKITRHACAHNKKRPQDGVRVNTHKRRGEGREKGG